MKFLMANFFSLVPAVAIGGLAWLGGAGHWALLIGWAIWGFGMDVCLNGWDSR